MRSVEVKAETRAIKATWSRELADRFKHVS